MATLNTAVVDVAVKDVKARKSKYAIFKLKELSVTVELIAPPAASQKGRAALLKDLSDVHPRWVLYDKEFKMPDQRLTSTVYFISWLPENTSQQDRMLYSTSKSVLLNHLSGIKIVEIENEEELEELLQDEVLK